MEIDTAANQDRDALVLGGGGSTGTAWELGVLTGLRALGIDLGTADLVVGTSAGALVGAYLAAEVDLDERHATAINSSTERPPRLSLPSRLRYSLAMARTTDPQTYRLRLGRLALLARTESEEARRAVIADRLTGVPEWPDRLITTAVDADSGEFVTFGAGDDVSLVDAVAASCAAPGFYPPTTIDGRRYIDGGVRSMANADVAEGCHRVIVLAPVTGGVGGMSRTEDEVDRLSEHSRVLLVTPDDTAKAAMGGSTHGMPDPTRRADAARAGRTQAESLAEAVARAWLA